MIDLVGLVRDFAGLPRPREDNANRLEAWMAIAHAAEPPYVHAFILGLDQDHDAVRAAVTLPFRDVMRGGLRERRCGANNQPWFI
ncbi:hypothetical protein ACFFMN_18460 [Planobispora siamensis]|uniref:Uncharacterized protein n=1 Tax=Planobispora siamensis TaxID=936338 RepID=A0A8J3WIW6_9ACTN|nr:hypothetical protein [Planobispora siamensis]GIH92239.1 hypothetical protein Psi01_28690 [Planobispora siamensis]